VKVAHVVAGSFTQNVTDFPLCWATNKEAYINLHVSGGMAFEVARMLQTRGQSIEPMLSTRMSPPASIETPWTGPEHV
jgi:hypothetical protein